MVPVPVASEISAFVGPDSVTVKVSASSSSVASSFVVTVNVFCVVPAGMTSRVADTAVKSAPETADCGLVSDVA